MDYLGLKVNRIKDYLSKLDTVVHSLSLTHSLERNLGAQETTQQSEQGDREIESRHQKYSI